MKKTLLLALVIAILIFVPSLQVVRAENNPLPAVWQNIFSIIRGTSNSLSELLKNGWPQTALVGSSSGSGLSNKVTIQTTNGTYEFLKSEAEDRGDFHSPAGFTQKNLCDTNPGLQYFTVCFRPDANGSRDEVVFEYGEFRMTPVKTGAYTARFYNGSSLLDSEEVTDHQFYQRWRWLPDGPRPRYRTLTSLEEEWLILPIREEYAFAGTLKEPSATYSYNKPLDSGGVYKSFPATGERPDLGLITATQASYLLSQSDAWWNAVLAQAEGGMSVCWNIRDEGGTPINFFRTGEGIYNRLKLTTHSNNPSFERPSGAKCDGWTPDSSHSPSLFYLPWVLTGDPYYLEGLQFQNSFNTLYTAINRQTTNLANVLMDQWRGNGWNIRTLSQLRATTPENVPGWLLSNSYYVRQSRENALDFERKFVNSISSFNQILHTPSAHSKVGPSFWQHDFVTGALAWGALMGNNEWRPSFNWAIQNQIARVNGTSGWPRWHPIIYYLNSVEPVTSWKDAWDLYVENNPGESVTEGVLYSPSNAYTFYLKGVLALATYLDVPGSESYFRWLYEEMDKKVNGSSYYKWGFAPKYALENGSLPPLPDVTDKYVPKPTPTPVPTPTPAPTPTPPPSQSSSRLKEIKITGDFALTTSCNANTAGKETCVFTITFEPKGSGVRTGSLSFLDTLTNTRKTIRLVGTGTNPTPAPTPAPTPSPSPTPTPASTQSEVGLQNGLVGYWTFDKNNIVNGYAKSTVGGNGLDGKLVGFDSISIPAGKIGEALEFDGLNDQVEIGDVLDQAGSYSIAIWVHPHTVSSASDHTDDRRIVAKDTESAGWALSLSDGGDGSLRFFIRSTSPIVTDTVEGTLQTGVWQHIVAVFDTDTNVRTIYVNGTKKAETTGVSGNPTNTTASLTIGGNASGKNNGNFDGYIDEVRIYNRALSASEVKDLSSITSAVNSHANTLLASASSEGGILGNLWDVFKSSFAKVFGKLALFLDWRNQHAAVSLSNTPAEISFGEQQLNTESAPQVLTVILEAIENPVTPTPTPAPAPPPTPQPSSSGGGGGGGSSSGSSGGGGGGVSSSPSSSSQSSTGTQTGIAHFSSPITTRNITRGTSGEDVRRLQQALNSFAVSRISSSGTGSPGNESTFFGSLTEDAVRRFQCNFMALCSGSPTTNGYGFVGPQTRAMLDVLTGATGAGNIAPTVSATPAPSAPTISQNNVSGSFATNLAPGSANSQVTLLQQYLASDSSLYPEKIVSGFYGTLTKLAVQRFQCRHLGICSGSPESNGYGFVGPRTQSKLNEIYSGSVPTVNIIPSLPTSVATSPPQSTVVEKPSLALFERVLKAGDQGEDVGHLQEILARDKTIYPEGFVTGIFSPLTEVAVRRFQCVHLFLCSGTPTSNGYGTVGPKTQEKLKSVLGE